MNNKNRKQNLEKGSNSMHRPAGLFTSAVLFLSLSLLAACATSPTTSRDDVVRERAEARWAALLSKDYESAYAFHSPGFRSTTELVDFMINIRLRKVTWTSSEYLQHSCDESVCKVEFKTGYRVRNPVPGREVWDGESSAMETWILSDGEWWYLETK